MGFLRSAWTVGLGSFLFVTQSYGDFPSTAGFSSDPRATAYLEDYMKRVRKHCKPDQYRNRVEVVFKNLSLKPEPIRGYCEKPSDGVRVLIDNDYWSVAEPQNRYELVAHELSHCLFDAKHSTDEKNFMYKLERRLSKEQISLQIDEFLKQRCRAKL